MKKMIIGYIIGMVASAVIVLSISNQSKAADNLTGTSNATDPTSTVDGTDTTSLLPDIAAIYHQALALPYQQVETEITDTSIAAFFRNYMAATGLDKVAGR